MNRKTQEKVADTLLEKGRERIIVTFLGVKIRLTINPLYLSTIASITKYAVQVDQVDIGAKALEVLGKAHEIAWPMALAAANGVLNKKLKRKLFARWLARIFMRSMTPSDLHRLFMMIIMQAGVKDFFECTVLIGQMNLATPKMKAGESKEEKPSGEPSQE